MLKASVSEPSTRFELVTEFEIAEVGDQFTRQAFVLDTGFTDFLLLRLAELDTYQGLKFKQGRVRLADGSEVEVWGGYFDVRVEGQVRQQVPALFLGPVNMIGMRFLHGALLRGTVKPGEVIEIDLPQSWFSV